jgi:hypothetical protein
MRFTPDLDDDGCTWVVRLRTTGADADAAAARQAQRTDEGGHLVLLASVQDQLLGAEPRWGSVEVVTYPSRSALPPVTPGPEPEIVLGARPVGWPRVPDDAPAWDQVPHPPTEEDPSVVVLHLIQFHDGGAQGDMVSYQDEAGKVAVPHGVRIDGWFGVTDQLAGDGRAWHQVRFNAFPSREAFMAVVFDPARLTAHKDHREVAIADTYTLVLRPVVNELAASVDATAPSAA